MQFLVLAAMVLVSLAAAIASASLVLTALLRLMSKLR
jgi:hypothetical protein